MEGCQSKGPHGVRSEPIALSSRWILEKRERVRASSEEIYRFENLKGYEMVHGIVFRECETPYQLGLMFNKNYASHLTLSLPLEDWNNDCFPFHQKV